MKKLIPDNQLPGFVGLIHREEGDEVVARYSDRTERDHATVFFRRELEPGETIRAVIPLTTIIQLGAETAVAFRPHSQFELEDLMYLLDNNEMADLANWGETRTERSIFTSNVSGATACFRRTTALRLRVEVTRNGISRRSSVVTS